MKTAMQELLEWHRKSMRSYSETNKMIEAYLEKEKEQIMNAYEHGYEACDMDEAFEINKKLASGELHYNQTYNQKIPELLYKDGTPMRKIELCKEAQELLDEATKRFNKNK
jgi:hypothetical protein